MSEFNSYAQRLNVIAKKTFSKYTAEDFEVFNRCRKIATERLGDGYEEIEKIRKELENEVSKNGDSERQLAVMTVFDKHVEFFFQACFMPELAKNWDSFMSEPIKNF